MEIRKYQAEDLEEIVQLFYETIQTVNGKDYSQEQVEVWSNRCENLRKNKTFFEKLYTVVAEGREDYRIWKHRQNRIFGPSVCA